MRSALSIINFLFAANVFAQDVTIEQLTNPNLSQRQFDSLFNEVYSNYPELPWDSMITSDLLSGRLEDELYDFSVSVASQLADRDVSQVAPITALIKEMPPYQDPSKRAFLHTLEAFVLYQQGELGNSIERYFEALALMDSVSDLEMYHSTQIKIGTLYSQLDDYSGAVPILRSSYERAEKVGTPLMLGESLFYLAGLLGDMDEYDSAITCLKKVIEIPEVADTYLYPYSYGEIGALYLSQEKFELGLKFQSKGIELERALDDYAAMIDSHGVLASCWAGLGELDSMAAHFDEALNLALKYEFYEKLTGVYESQAEVYAYIEDYESAYEALSNFNLLQDSIYGLEVLEIKENMQARYETDKKTAQNELLKSENQRQQGLLYGAGILILGIILVVLYIYRTNKKTQKLNERISSQALELSKSNRTKDRLFSIIGHDLRSPISSFETLTSIISSYLKKGETERVKEIVSHVDATAKNMKFLLENLLEWSLNQQNEIQLTIKPITLKTIVDEVVEVYAETSALKKVQIISEIKEEQVLADYDTLSTLLRNLISNALKFSPESSKVEIKAQHSNKFVEISIRDEGAGISSENQLKLFTIDKTKVRKGTAKEKGTGLGLVLVREFVELNRGHVKVESTVGKGSTFYVSLPAAD